MFGSFKGIILVGENQAKFNQRLNEWRLVHEEKGLRVRNKIEWLDGIKWHEGCWCVCVDDVRDGVKGGL